MPDMQTALTARLLAAAGVTAIAGQRQHWNAVPQGTAYPCMRMQTISDPRPQHLRATDRGRQTRVQVDCFAKTFAQARALADAVIAATAQPATVSGVRFGRTRAEGPRDLGEQTPEGFIHRMSVDLLIEHAS